ncbi:DEAD/DEAH box helicase [Photobacterium profundum]|uniref:DNA repair helicase n=1 Tax=Photobacterium profundum 3TCK TaxID=314280 RepID=Q1Z306_9GAMM|nr:DEAD/DEAH box helicase [Photobacterium profundum]EAS42983.1 DNA repair helicase [Photobacterium profundum 3TCK]
MNCAISVTNADTPQNNLVLNNEHDNFFNELRGSFHGCKRFYINVAFVSYSGLQILLDILKEAGDKGGVGKVITSTYLNFTDPKALDKLLTFKNIELKLFITKPNLGFHPKGYIFEYASETKVIVGSSNITQSALKSNVEWNVATTATAEDPFVTTVMNEFNSIWTDSVDVTDEVLEQYRSFLKTLAQPARTSTQFVLGDTKIEPNTMQAEALNNLRRLRMHGESKALAIAATGSGKTYMAAFDVREVAPKRMLFVVHREEILLDARKSFIRVMGEDPAKFGILSGNQKDWDCDYLFATNLTLRNNLDHFEPDHFEYIVIDEAHHVSSDTYQKALAYFEPGFLLGMTATPERGDAQSIYENFDNNIAVEIRLRDALDADLVTPFHYFGITEAGSVDYEGVNLNDIDAVAKLLQTNRRVDHIVSNMDFYGYDGDTCRAVGFCVNVKHARYMAEEFNKAGITACYLNSESSRDERQNAIKRLSSDVDPLQIIFTVDLFNEGIDIPAINLVLMLRPTSSPIVFIQQLGRGLRKHESKTFLTVLDFIGNHNKAFLMAIALCGSRFYDKDSLKVAVKKDFSSIPGCTHIQLDPISKEQILRQIEDENFNSMKYLKEEYLNFKLDLGNRIPNLMDFYVVDGAPDPIRYIKKERSYLNFLSKVEKNESSILPLIADSLHDKYQRYFDGCLPIKRPHEFVIMSYLIVHESITLTQAKYEIERYLVSVDLETLKHAFDHINGNFFDSREKKTWPKLAELVDAGGELMLMRSSELTQLASQSRQWLLTTLEYGLERYAESFGSEALGTPSLKLYQQYNMRDIALMANVRKTHSSYRGTGVLREGNDFFFFVDLHKEEGAIDYKDKFISSSQFQWDSPSGCSPISKQGREIINHKESDIKLHLFVRKFKDLDGVTEPYVYIGKGDVVSYEGEKPINFQLNLQTQVSQAVYDEFVTDTAVS